MLNGHVWWYRRGRTLTTAPADATLRALGPVSRARVRVDGAAIAVAPTTPERGSAGRGMRPWAQHLGGTPCRRRRSGTLCAGMLVPVGVSGSRRGREGSGTLQGGPESSWCWARLWCAAANCRRVNNAGVDKRMVCNKACPLELLPPRCSRPRSNVLLVDVVGVVKGSILMCRDIAAVLQHSCRVGSVPQFQCSLGAPVHCKTVTEGRRWPLERASASCEDRKSVV